MVGTMKRAIITILIVLIAFAQMASASVPFDSIDWDGNQGLTSAQLNCNDDKAPSGEDGYLHWIFIGATNVTYAVILVDGEEFPANTYQGNNVDFYTTPYYEFDTLKDKTVTVQYALNDPDANLDANAMITLSHYCPGDYEVPEFPTIAVPIAAIIGIAFLMQRRKE
jgi:hypothetical protein